MGRDRSKSIVKRIASDVPFYTEDNLNVGDSVEDQHQNESIPTNRTNIKKYRSKSFSLNRTKCSLDPERFTLYPFSNKEYESLWLNYINYYNYNTIISNDQVMKVANVSSDSILNFQSNCQSNIATIDNIYEETERILKSLDTLVLSYDKVSSETSDFADQSTKLLNRQMKYETISKEIQESLMTFESLESITKTLTSPGNNLIKRQSFQEILNKLDTSLGFIEKHPNFKDVELYKVRFRQCMTRSLTLIRNYLISELKSIHDGIQAKLNKINADKSNVNNNITVDILLYNEFNNYIKEDEEEFHSFPKLVNEIVKRIEYHEEYKGLLHDVLQQYFKIRSSLVDNYIWNHLNSISKKNKDLVQFSQDNISFFKKILEREFTSFNHYFQSSDLSKLPSYMNTDLYTWCKNLLDPLYDTLRNRVIRETNITTLCQLTTLLQKYYEFEDDESLSVSFENQINYGELFEPILQTVQSRLVFRIQIYIDDRLIKYKPKPEDLKIGNRKKNSSTTIDDSAKEENPLDVDYSENLFKDLYLPLGKALTILSNIYELINSAVFDDLAHYIVHSCIYILKNGAYKLSLTHLGKIDSKLYYLKNLIILQHQLNNFDIQYVRTETTLDFTGGINEIFQTLRNGEFIYNYNQNGGFIELVKKSAPKVINNMIDAKYEIESELNNAVNDFITECANIISEPILSKSRNEAPLQKSLLFRDNLMIELPKFHKEIRFFINDINIIKFLVDNLCNIIISTYENFYQQLELDLENNEDLKQDMQDIMEMDTLIGFITDLVSGLYENDEMSPPPVEFNEDILNDDELNVSE